MSQQADQIRDRRRAFAAPGGPLDRAVRVLAVALPALVGAVFATMLIAPLSPRGEVSFILDRNKVAIANDRLRVDSAMYRGEDNRGRPFSLSAGEALQVSAADPVVQLRDLTAQCCSPRDRRCSARPPEATTSWRARSRSTVRLNFVAPTATA
jgi:lipopolysaccharide export system protein LptC